MNPTWGTPVDDPTLVGEPLSLPEVLSAAEAPEMVNQLSAEAMKSSRPEMPAPSPGYVELPGGVLRPDGTLLTFAQVRELTGRDEERLSRVDPLQNLPLFLQTLVKCGVETIGSDAPDPEDFKNMLIGDREALILGIRIATYGNELEVHITCPNCGTEADMAVELDKDIPIKKMETPEVRTYDVELRNGSIAVVTPATVGMQDEIFSNKKSAAEMKTATLQRCILTIDGSRVNHNTVLNLGLADRKKLIEFLAELQPGPDYEGVRLPCESCGRDYALALDLADLFR